MLIYSTYHINYNSQIQIPPEALCRTYGTVLTFNEKLKIHFETDVAMLGQYDDKGYIYFINKKQVYINNKEPELLVDRMADKMGKVIYPLLLVVDHNGYIIKHINQEDIIERWKQVKEGLEQYYKGAIAENAIEQMELALKNKNRFIESVKKDWFMAVFFPGIHSDNISGFKLTPDFLFPVTPYGPLVKYTATGSLVERNTEAKTFIIEYKGKVNEDRSREDIENKTPVPIQQFMFENSTVADGEMNLKYSLYHRDHSTRWVNGTVSLQLAVGKKHIEIGTYHQEGRDKKLKEAIEIQEPGKAKRPVI